MPMVASSVQTVERTDRSLVHSARTLATNTFAVVGDGAGRGWRWRSCRYSLGRVIGGVAGQLEERVLE
jgi:hypothetical protein